MRLTVIAVLLAGLGLGLAPAAANARTRPPVASQTPSPASGRAAAARVRRYWTPARMQSARPLYLAVDGSGRSRLRAGRPAAAASASFLAVETPEAPPYSVN